MMQGEQKLPRMKSVADSEDHIQGSQQTTLLASSSLPSPTAHRRRNSSHHELGNAWKLHSVGVTACEGETNQITESRDGVEDSRSYL